MNTVKPYKVSKYFTLIRKPGHITQVTWPEVAKKFFGRPTKAKSRIGQDSPWHKKDRRRKSKQNKKKNL